MPHARSGRDGVTKRYASATTRAESPLRDPASVLQRHGNLLSLRDVALPASIVALGALGLRASLRMLRKSQLDAEGRLEEPSVVQLPDAKLFFGIPNSAIGAGFYSLVIAGQTLPRGRVRERARLASTAVASCAAAVSAFLATRIVQEKLDCSNCWTAHGVNAALVGLLALQAKRS